MKTIREHRQERNWTQFELALKVGVQTQAVYLWESGRRTPHVAQLRKLGELFGICSDEILLVSSAGGDGHRAHADRQPGESAPGRDRPGLAAARPGGVRSTDRADT